MRIKINGKFWYIVNCVLYVNLIILLKLVDWYNIFGVFDFKIIKNIFILGLFIFGILVLDFVFYEYVEFVF